MSSDQEEQFHQKIRKVYNSGDCANAVALSIEFLQKFPQSLLARYCYAVMHGDYSYSPVHGEAEKQRLLAIAKQGMAELYNDPQRNQWDAKFVRRVRNEYYWFFELYDEQYGLGVELLAQEEEGHYSACVGASMMALKMLKAKSKSQAEDWAKRSLYHFAEFEKVSPDWYNINFFAAQALACLGKYEEALATYKDMYRKQKAPVNQIEVDDFQKKMNEIIALRS